MSFQAEAKVRQPCAALAARENGRALVTPGASRASIGSGAPTSRRSASAAIAACAAIALLAFTASASAAPNRSLQSSFGTFSGSAPQALTVDQSNGDVYAVDTDNNQVRRFDSSGAPKNFTAGPDAGTNTLTGFNFDGPSAAGVAIDNSGGPADGSIYVADSFGNLVAIYDATGAHLGTIDGSGTDNGIFSEPCGVAVDQSSGDLYIGDYIGRVWRYSPAGAIAAESDYTGGIDPGFHPCQVAADNGHVYAVDWDGTGPLVRFKDSSFALGLPPAPTGNEVTAIGRAIATDPQSGDLYVDEGSQIAVFHASGTHVYDFGSSADFGFNSAGVAVAGGGKAYVADRNGNQIDVYSAEPIPNRSLQSSFGTFSGSAPQALTVDQSNGDVYAVDTDNNQVRRFDSSGAPKNFTAGPDAGTNTLTGFNFDGPSAAGVAIDNSGGPADGSIYVADSFGNLVAIYDATGAHLGTIDGSGTDNGIFSEPCGVAVDQSSGDLYIGDYIGRVWRYSPAGAIAAESDYTGGIDPGFHPCQVAADNGHVYAVDWDGTGPLVRFKDSSFALGLPPAPTGNEVTAIGRAIATDPQSGDLYVDEGSQIAVFHASGTHVYDFGSSADFGFNSAGVAVAGGGKAYVADRNGNQIDVYGPPAYGNVLTVQKPGPGGGVVTSSPPGINCGVVCQATYGSGTVVTLTAVADSGSLFKSWTGCDSTAGADCTVTSAGEKSVSAFFAAPPAVTDESADQILANGSRLTARVNPQGDSTTYHFEYGTDTSYGESTPESSPIGSDTDLHFVSRPISGLDPGTTYHFRVVATNGADTTEGADHTFTTFSEAPTFDPCPNDDKRSGLGEVLPDCRAYEQVSPVDKNGADAQGYPNDNQASTSGDAVTFVTHQPIPGGQGAQEFPFWMARRGDDSWSTKGLMPPASFGYRAFPSGWTSDLKYSFFGASSLSAPEGLGPALLMQDTAANTFTTVHGHTNGNPLASSTFVDASADGSKVYFERSDPPALTPDAIPGRNNLYVWDRDSGAISLAGVLPDSACGTPPCVPAGGSFAGPWDYLANSRASGGITRNYHVQFPNAISDDGSKAFFTSGDEAQLYLRKDAGTTAAMTEHISASQRTDCADSDPCTGNPKPDPLGSTPASFQRATPSGSKAFFTSSEELTDDANTGPVVTEFPAIARADKATAATEISFLPASAQDVAVDGSYIYWADPKAGSIGRATLDGTTEVDPDFIIDAGTPRAVAVDASHVYWTSDANITEDFDTGLGGTIGRADLSDGSNADPDCITTTLNPAGLAIGVGADANHLYWGGDQPRLSSDADHSVGRADIAGDCASADASASQNFLHLGDRPTGVAVDSAHLYVHLPRVDQDSGGHLARANLDGTGFDRDFIFPDTGFQPGRDSDVAVDDTYVYWTDSGHNKVGRALLNGTGTNLNFVATPGQPKGLAVDSSHLYWVTNQQGNVTNPGNDLYAYDAASGQLHDLTPDSTPGNTCPIPPFQVCGAQVQGVVGSSDDGDYVYFAANGDLDGAGPATLGDCRRTNQSDGRIYAGTCSLYLWHAGDISFVARMNPEPGGADGSDGQNWNALGFATGNTVRPTSARVSSDGKTLVFRSNLQQTAYDNTERTELGTINPTSGTPNDTGRGACVAAVGFQRCSEYYRFNTDSGLNCLTCNPSGQRPGSEPTMRSQVDEGVGIDNAGWVNSRNMSADGNRFFFESLEKLVAADINGDSGCPTVEVSHRTKCQDVYEWEAPGTGSCTLASSAYSTQNAGCIYLISSGKSPDVTYFLDSSASGDDVFFFTRKQLVPQDGDGLVDIYDARVDGGLSSQLVTPPAGCSPEDCQGGGSTSPPDADPGSSDFTGPGNQGKNRGDSTATPPKKKTKKCKKHRKPKKGKCVKKHSRTANKAGRAG